MVELLHSYKKLGCQMPLIIDILHSHMDFILETWVLDVTKH
jgi:hypothetical protein